MTIKQHLPFAISWSGGKDCFLAYVTLLAQGVAKNEEILFVTFVPEHGDFLCHPLAILEQQGKLLNVTHEFIIIDEVNWMQGYFNALKYLKENYQTRSFVTGEVFLDDHAQESYWINDILEQLGITLANPVTPQPAQYMLELLSYHQITARTTGIKEQFFHPDFLAKPISWDLLESTNLSQIQNFGWYGENGEYHTLVTEYQQLVFSPEFPSSTTIQQKGEVIGLNLPTPFHRLVTHQRIKCPQ